MKLKGFVKEIILYYNIKILNKKIAAAFVIAVAKQIFINGKFFLKGYLTMW
jgi:hypothetical protein